MPLTNSNSYDQDYKYQQIVKQAHIKINFIFFHDTDFMHTSILYAYL